MENRNIFLKNIKLAIFFGGPSSEKNISLDSARTFYDSIRHKLSESHIKLVFISEDLSFYNIPSQFIYSNTIEDFADQLLCNENAAKDGGIEGEARRGGIEGGAGRGGIEGGAGRGGIEGGAGRGGIEGGSGREGIEGEAGRGGIEGGARGGGIEGEAGRGGIEGEAGRGGIEGEAGRGGIEGEAGRGGIEGEARRGGIEGGAGRGSIEGEARRGDIEGGAGRGGIEGGAERGGIEGGAGRGAIEGKAGRGGIEGGAGRGGIEGRAGRGGIEGGAGRGGIEGGAGRGGIEGVAGRGGIEGEAGRGGIEGEAGRGGNEGEAGRGGIEGGRGRGSIEGEAGRGGIEGKAGRGGIEGQAGRGGIEGEAGRGGIEGGAGRGGIEGGAGRGDERRKKNKTQQKPHKKQQKATKTLTIYSSDANKLSPLTPLEIARIINESHVLVPLVHGKFGEDGKLIRLFEAHHRHAYVGSDAETLAQSLNKRTTQTHIAKLGLKSARNVFFNKKQSIAKMQAEAVSVLGLSEEEYFFVKPNDGGSSDGVQQVQLANFAKAIKNAKKYSNEILVEKKILGKEFSIIVLEDDAEECFPLVPSEVRLQASLTENKSQVFYTRKRKYLPGSGAQHITPASFSNKIINAIRSEAAQLYTGLRFRLWARFDGFVTPSGEIVWAELNGIPGMGQDGFLFQQSAIAGLDATGVTLLLIRLALRRENITLITSLQNEEQNRNKLLHPKPTPIAVIGGGESSERQVSRMSWHNVCTKLKSVSSEKIIKNKKVSYPTYNLNYIFLDTKKKFWEVPHAVTLLHTVEEIDTVLANKQTWHQRMQKSAALLSGFKKADSTPMPLFPPREITLRQLSKKCCYAFLALHGGIGENGKLQANLKKAGMSYNGSDEKASWLCASKLRSSQHISKANIAGISAIPNKVITYKQLTNVIKKISLPQRNMLINNFSKANTHVALTRCLQNSSFLQLRNYVKCFLNSVTAGSNFSYENIVIKPTEDGCSTGVLVLPLNIKKLQRQNAMAYYFLVLTSKLSYVPLFHLDPLCDDTEQRLLLPEDRSPSAQLILEKQINTQNREAIEITVGVIEKKAINKKTFISLLPSQTVSLRSALSLEEKFNKGMGANLTPPQFLTSQEVRSIRSRVAKLATHMKLSNYARIDFFYELGTKQLYLIEVNTLPGLTAATVLYTQALLTPQIKLKPADFLSYIIELKLNNKKTVKKP